MDVATLAQLIGSLGFPIVCCGVLFYHMFESDKQHKEEMEKLSEAVNNNTIALTQLTDKIGGV